MRKIVKNFDQEAFDDNWHENRMRLASLIQRNNGNVIVEQDPIGEEIPIVHSAETIVENLEPQFSGNEEREPAESETTNEESPLERTVFEDSNTTILHSQHDDFNSNFNRLDEDHEIGEDEEMGSLTSDFVQDPNKLAKEVDKDGIIWYFCGICSKKCKGVMGLNLHMTKSKVKHV